MGGVKIWEFGFQNSLGTTDSSYAAILLWGQYSQKDKTYIWTIKYIKYLGNIDCYGGYLGQKGHSSAIAPPLLILSLPTIIRQSFENIVPLKL